MSALPKGWAETTLADAVVDGAAIIYGILQPGPDLPDGIPYVRPTEIQNGTIAVNELRRTASDIAERYSRSKLEVDDLILSIVGTIGKVAVVPAELRGANITQSSCRIRADQDICVRDWMKYFLVSPLATKYYNDTRLGTAVPRLNLEDVRLFLLPLPPLAEQKRIVAKLDALNAKSTRARTELARIETLVARYKQAVLAKAFSGLDAEGVLLEDLSTFITSGSRGWAKFYSDHGPSFIRIGNTVRGAINLDLQDIQHVIPPSGAEGTRTRIQSNDLMITITADLGRIGHAPQDLGEAYVNQHLALVRLKQPAAARFVAWYLVSDLGQAQLHRNNRGATKAGLGLDDIRQVEVPFPLAHEQHEIVRRIESAFARIDRLAIEAKRALALLGRLDEAILAKAFRGELVPQDAADEPAEQLLARIRAEREAAPKTKRGRGKQA